MTEKFNNLRLVWIDLEMTGLDPNRERILEIATVLTDSDLNILAEGPVFCISQDEKLLLSMDEWNQDHHTASGLLERVRKEGVSEREAELGTLAFLKDWIGTRESPLCGNSIGTDRNFLAQYMCELEEFLHYRNLDVSTVKELAVRWRPDIAEEVKKRGSHRALDDIKESIEELKFYRQRFFKLVD